MGGAAVRWSSAGPVAGEAARPWTLNRYSYAWNDPANYLDPDGGEPRFVQCVDWFIYSRIKSEKAWRRGPALTTCTYTARERGQGGGGGGPAGAPTGSAVGGRATRASSAAVERDSQRFRLLLQRFVQYELSENCRRFLSTQGIAVSAILQHARVTQFWDVRVYALTPIADVVGPDGGSFGGARVLGDLLPAAWAAAVVVRNQAGQVFPHVVFGAGFRTGLDVLHEMLHIVTEKADVDLANSWGLGPFVDDPSGRAQASQAITLFLDPDNWDCGSKIGWNP